MLPKSVLALGVSAADMKCVRACVRACVRGLCVHNLYIPDPRGKHTCCNDSAVSDDLVVGKAVTPIMATLSA